MLQIVSPKDPFDAVVVGSGATECLARKENYVEIDGERVDAWGIPVLKIHAEYGDNEKKLFHAAIMMEAAGARNVRVTGEYSVPGFCIHEIGTAQNPTLTMTATKVRACDYIQHEYAKHMA